MDDQREPPSRPAEQPLEPPPIDAQPLEQPLEPPPIDAQPSELPPPAALPPAIMATFSPPPSGTPLAPPGPPLAPPGPPVPTHVYALPTARKVVASGLQLALASTSDLRRASIYIGLLVLGAFGPAIIAILLIVGRLGDQAGDTLGSLLFNGGFGAPVQPALGAALFVVAIEAFVGLALFLTISIDAQIMAIAILGGRASERPLRLWEAILRARQVFWRMAGAGMVVGIVGAIIQGVLATALGGVSRSLDAASVIAGIVSTVVVAPLAYVSTSIVIGDVGAMEALSRSWRLFKARRLLAVVVVLFTFVTSAIQLFALSAGLDLVVRASDLLHVSLTEGAGAFAIAVVLILAAVVAYGSLTFTIGAIVSAPQVAGFLGLTFFAGGLDKARVDSPKPPPGFRYISRPMAVSMIALTAVVGLQIPAISSIEAPISAPTAAFLRAEADAHAWVLSTVGYEEPTTDPTGDVAAGAGGAPPTVDIVLGDYAWVPFVPDWLLKETFACEGPAVICGDLDLLTSSYEDGAILFLTRVAGDVDDVSACNPCEFGAVIAVSGEARGPAGARLLPDASHAFLATIDADGVRLVRHTWYLDQDTEFGTRARFLRRGSDLLLLVPVEELPAEPVSWNVRATARTGRVAGSDRLGDVRPMLPWGTFVPDLWLDPPGGLAP